MVVLCFTLACRIQGKKDLPRPEDRLSYLEANARKQIEVDGSWTPKSVEIKWNPNETAIVICDMWDKHWCDSATARVSKMAPKINAFISKARARGVTIVHAPSSTIAFYQDHPARKKVLTYGEVKPPITLQYWFDPDSTREGPLPIDDSDEGCDAVGNEPYTAWSRQIASIEISDEEPDIR